MYFIVGCIILCLLILGYIGILTTMYIRRNPTIPDVISKIEDSTWITEDSLNKMEEERCTFVGLRPMTSDIKKQSTVSYTYLGDRGDMGNQIFQLACVIAAGNRSDANVVLPTKISKLPINELFDLTQYEQKDIIPDAKFYEYDNYENIVIPQDGRNYDIHGYRQSYLYFDDYSSLVRKIFVPRDNIINAVKSVTPPEYIAIHIRKGDYIKPMHKISLLREFKQCQLEYYKQGILKLREYYPNCPILVCTDSPKWVTPLLQDLDSKAILAPIPSGLNPKFSDFSTLYLADAVVMSNSTYSFWACYLRNHRSIICPSPWWDPVGFIANGLNLDKPYLQYPEWWILDADTGTLVREPCPTEKLSINYNNSDTLNLYRLIRGMLL